MSDLVSTIDDRLHPVPSRDFGDQMWISWQSAAYSAGNLCILLNPQIVNLIVAPMEAVATGPLKRCSRY
jgi:hypothetical protein